MKEKDNQPQQTELESLRALRARYGLATILSSTSADMYTFAKTDPQVYAKEKSSLDAEFKDLNNRINARMAREFNPRTILANGERLMELRNNMFDFAVIADKTAEAMIGEDSQSPDDTLRLETTRICFYASRMCGLAVDN